MTSTTSGGLIDVERLDEHDVAGERNSDDVGSKQYGAHIQPVVRQRLCELAEVTRDGLTDESGCVGMGDSTADAAEHHGSRVRVHERRHHQFGEPAADRFSGPVREVLECMGDRGG